MALSLNSAIVRIRTADGRVVGAGFLVSERQVLTCAHVVAQALGIREENGDVPQGEVSLDFPLVAPGEQLTAKIVWWQPDSDVAGLKLDQAPPVGASPNRLVKADDPWGHSFRAFGFPQGYNNGVWASGRVLAQEATGWLQIEDVKETGYFVAPGFSGAPV
jgi:S1-C subfamily serine protease